jgi:heme A synthase
LKKPTIARGQESTVDGWPMEGIKFWPRQRLGTGVRRERNVDVKRQNRKIQHIHRMIATVVNTFLGICVLLE